jgi:3-oxoacyl-[acyl-carrier protein] reductase
LERSPGRKTAAETSTARRETGLPRRTFWADAAAKAGLVGAVKSLAVELAARGITVNAIAPGVMDVGMSAAMPPEAAESARKSIPMQRFGRPVEIASLVSYLLSDGAAYLTRQVISVNGGMY